MFRSHKRHAPIFASWLPAQANDRTLFSWLCLSLFVCAAWISNQPANTAREGKLNFRDVMMQFKQIRDISARRRQNKREKRDYLKIETASDVTFPFLPVTLLVPQVNVFVCTTLSTWLSCFGTCFIIELELGTCISRDLPCLHFSQFYFNFARFFRARASAGGRVCGRASGRSCAHVRARPDMALFCNVHSQGRERASSCVIKMLQLICGSSQRFIPHGKMSSHSSSGERSGNHGRITFILSKTNIEVHQCVP